MAGISVIRGKDRLRLVLAGEGRHNALRARDWRVIGRVARAIAEARTLPAAVVLTGAGHDFSVGMDLHALAALSLPEADEALAAMDEAVASVAAIPVPVIARIDGAAWGGGLFLALAADVALASGRATFALPVTAHGIVLGERMWALLSGVIAPAVARDMLWSGRTIGAREAEMRGVVSRAVSTDALDQAVDDLVGKVAALAPAIRREWKKTSRAGTGRGARTRFADAEAFEITRRRYPPRA